MFWDTYQILIQTNKKSPDLGFFLALNALTQGNGGRALVRALIS
jgi:hypothetical protein